MAEYLTQRLPDAGRYRMRIALGVKNRIIPRQAARTEIRRYAQAGEYDPDIMPWVVLIGTVHMCGMRLQQKTFSRLDFNRFGENILSFFAGGLKHNHTFSRYNVMKNVFITNIRAKGIQRRTLLIADFQQRQILAGVEIKKIYYHVGPSLPS